MLRVIEVLKDVIKTANEIQPPGLAALALITVLAIILFALLK